MILHTISSSTSQASFLILCMFLKPLLHFFGVWPYVPFSHQNKRPTFLTKQLYYHYPDKSQLPLNLNLVLLVRPMDVTSSHHTPTHTDTFVAMMEGNPLKGQIKINPPS